MSSDQFAHWLKRQLKRRDWLAADLARRMDIAPSVVSRWVRGERIPNPQSCELLAEALAVDPDEVLEAAGHRPPSYDLPAGDPRRTVIALIEQLDPSDPTTLFWLESLPPTIEKLKRLGSKREKQ